MKTGFYGISDTLDTMMENRIYGKNTVDAVLQDNAVILEESNASFLYRKPDVAQYRFEEYITQDQGSDAINSTYRWGNHNGEVGLYGYPVFDSNTGLIIEFQEWFML